MAGKPGPFLCATFTGVYEVLPRFTRASNDLVKALSRRRTSLILGRPPRGLDFQRQYRPSPTRCYLTTASWC